MSNIPGMNFENIYMLLVSYILVLMINKKTGSKSAMLLLAIVTFHQVIAYLYAFHLSRPPNELDSASFVYLASECTKFGYCGYFGEHLYANFLAKALILGDSIYIVFLINIILFVLSLYFFIGISNLLNLKAYRKAQIVLYSMWPSVIYYTTLNYRETFELYLLVAATYFVFSGCKSDSTMRLLMGAVLLFIMGIFHMKGLTYLSPVLFLILVTYKFTFNIYSLVKKSVLLILMGLAVYFSQIMYTEYVSEVRAAKHEKWQKKIIGYEELYAKRKGAGVVSERTRERDEERNNYFKKKNYPPKPGYVDKLIRKITYYRASIIWGKPPRSAFISNISDKSIPIFTVTFIIVYLEYLFSPFVFQVNSYLSLLAYAESILRLILFISSLFLIKRHPQLRVLFVMYLAITAMWSIGVVSFGAGIRHHIQTNWILVLLGVPIIYDYFSRMLRVRFMSQVK